MCRPTSKTEQVKVPTELIVDNCTACGGRGGTRCPPRVICTSCSGGRWARCPTHVDCPQCDGEGLEYRECHDCFGTGPLSGCETCRSAGRLSSRCRHCGARGWITCARCSGRGMVPCQNCSQTGEVRCQKCQGRGYLACRQCSEEGQITTARVVTRKFTHRSNSTVAGEDGSNFRNGLSSSNFSGLPGLIQEEVEQPPDQSNVVRQRRRIERFDVTSLRYGYNEREFFVNHIAGDGSTRERASAGLPVSPIRAAAGIGTVVAIVGILVTLYVVLGM